MTRVVYTGTRKPDDSVSGVELHHLPMLETVPRPLGPDAAEALALTSRPRYAVFYSQNAAEYVLDSLGVDAFEGCEVWAVGNRTARYLTDRIGQPVSAPEKQTFGGLREALKRKLTSAAVVVSFELASGERRLADENLRGTVVSVPAYDTLPYRYDDLDSILRRIGPRWVVFGSPRAYETFRANLYHRVIGDSYRVAAIGPTTRDAITRGGDRVDLTPEKPDLAALLRDLGER